MKNQSKSGTVILLFGGIILDRYFTVESYPTRGQDVLIDDAYNRVGGCSINVAMTLHNLGCFPCIVSKVGDDAVGNEIYEYLTFRGLPDACISRSPGRQSGYCLNILEKSGERTFFTYRGCEAEFSPIIVPHEVLAIAAFAYVTGYFLLDRQAASAVMALLEPFWEAGGQIVFDPGPLVASIAPNQLRRMLALTDWLVPNASELEIIQNHLEIHGNAPERLLEMGCRGLLVKKGAQGVDVYSVGGEFSIPGFPVTPIDSTGAGDSFAGGLIHALANQLDLRSAVVFASTCGAYSTLYAGPHSVFSRADIEKLISKNRGVNEC